MHLAPGWARWPPRLRDTPRVPELRVAESWELLPLVSAIVGEAMISRFSGILTGIAASRKKRNMASGWRLVGSRTNQPDGLFC
jgi:hypothetical protein